MRCDCCDRVLNDYESTLKGKSSGSYLNTCIKCLDGLGIELEGRQDLNPFEEVSQELLENEDGWDE